MKNFILIAILAATNNSAFASCSDFSYIDAKTVIADCTFAPSSDQSSAQYQVQTASGCLYISPGIQSDGYAFLLDQVLDGGNWLQVAHEVQSWGETRGDSNNVATNGNELLTITDSDFGGFNKAESLSNISYNRSTNILSAKYFEQVGYHQMKLDYQFQMVCTSGPAGKH